MSYFVPRSAGFDTATKDRTSLRYIRLHIDVLDDDNFVDMTSYIDWRGGLSGGGSGQGEFGISTKRYSIRLKNSNEYFSEGDYAGHKCYLQAKMGTSEYITFFTGFINEKGCTRSKQSKSGDIVTLVMQDASRSRGMRKKLSATTYVNYKICDTGSPGTSLFHKLADAIGYTSSDVETTAINQTKDYLPLDPKKTVWQELQELSAQYIGHMTFRYDGKLRFISRHQQGWSEPSSEWTFQGSNATGDQNNYNIHNWKGQLSPIACNKIKTEFAEYESLGQQTIYKNTDDWDRVNARNAISVVASAYWPGSNAGDKAKLYYQDPKSGEKFPLGITIQTPTIGGVGSGSDIECENGLLTLVSFNGSTAATMQRPSASEIILQNATGSTVIIRKFELRGTPLREQKIKTVELIDASIVNDWEYRDKTIPGKYGVSDTQAGLSCERWLEFGKVERKIFTLTTDWIPQIQEGAVVTFNPDSSINMSVVVEKYNHRCAGKYRQWRTSISVREKETFTSSATPDIVIDSPGNANTTELDNMVTTTDIIEGFTTGGGTKTPTQVTVAVCKPVGKKAILLIWDKQLNLTNFDHYDIQVSEDQSDWYSLAFDGEGAFKGWGSQIAGLTENPGEMVVHSNIPNTGTTEDPLGQLLYYRVRRVTKAAVDGTWSAIVSATSLTVESGDIAAHTVYLNNLVAGVLNAMIGEFSNYIQVSSDGYLGTSYLVGGEPTPGLSTRARLDANELIIEFYDNTSTWITITKMGGDEAGGFFPWFQARGLIKTGAVSEVEALDIGHKVPSGGKIFNFDNSYVDRDNVDPWDTKKDLVAFTADAKYGTYALSANLPTAGYQECGLSGKSESSIVGLTIGDTYYLKITVDGGTETEYNFTATDNNSFTYTSFGAVVASGLATTSRSPFVCIGSGSVVVSGKAFLQHTGSTYTYTGKEGVSIAGGAATERTSPVYEYSGSGRVDISGTGIDIITFAELIASLNAIVASATFSINGGDLRCTSNTSGDDSSIVLAVGTTGTDLFGSINGYTAFDSAVQGMTGGYIEDENANGILWNEDFGINFWYNIPEAPAEVQKLLELKNYVRDSLYHHSAITVNDVATHNLAISYIDDSHFVVTYIDGATPTDITSRVGTITGITITLGSKHTSTATSSLYTQVLSTAILDTTHFVAIYKTKTGTTYYIRAVVGVISGNTITFGSEYTAISIDEDIDGDISAINATHFVVAYRNDDGTGYGSGDVKVGTVSNGDEISFGSAYSFYSVQTANTIYMDTLDVTHIVIAFRSALATVAYAIVGTVSGSVVTFGSAYETHVTSSVIIGVTCLTSTKFIINYKHSTDDGWLRCGEISNVDEISYGTALKHSNDAYLGGVSTLDDTHFILIFRDGENSENTSVKLGEVDGTTISLETAVSIDSGTCQTARIVGFDSDRYVTYFYEGVADNVFVRLGIVTETSLSIQVEGNEIERTFINTQSATNTSESVIITTGWHFIGINYDNTDNKLYLTVGSATWIVNTSSLDTEVQKLLIYLPDVDYRIDNLVIMPSDFFADTSEYNQYGYIWSKSVDELKDLVLIPKDGGDIVSPKGHILSWQKIDDPPVDWKAQKTTWAAADSFSAGLEVTFSEVPAGAKAVRVSIYMTTASNLYYRKSGDTNISNTPNASLEYSHWLGSSISGVMPLCEIWLSADYKAQFTVSNTGTDLYIAYPGEYLI